MKRALHVCPIPGCPELVSGSARYCAKHERERRPVDTRPSSAKRGYDAEWQKIRSAFLAAHPQCTFPGCSLPSTEAHHVIAVRDGGSHDENNLRAYCKKHHAQITAQEQPGGFRKVLKGQVEQNEAYMG
jgi:5-methylcytosine-specific restriction protein A